jgi:hypothetical protein
MLLMKTACISPDKKNDVAGVILKKKKKYLLLAISKERVNATQTFLNLLG